MASVKEATAAKKDKPGKEDKKPKGKAEGAEGEMKTRKYADNTKIQILNKENPHREGSSRSDAFAAVVKCKTMGEYYATDHKIKYIEAWVESGHIKVA